VGLPWVAESTNFRLPSKVSFSDLIAAIDFPRLGFWKPYHGPSFLKYEPKYNVSRNFSLKCLLSSRTLVFIFLKGDPSSLKLCVYPNSQRFECIRGSHHSSSVLQFQNSLKLPISPDISSKSPRYRKDHSNFRNCEILSLNYFYWYSVYVFEATQLYKNCKPLGVIAPSNPHSPSQNADSFWSSGWSEVCNIAF